MKANMKDQKRKNLNEPGNTSEPRHVTPANIPERGLDDKTTGNLQHRAGVTERSGPK